MSSDLAVTLEGVTKEYPLYVDEREQMIDIFTPKFIRRKRRQSRPKFTALDNISIEIPKGKRLALIGKNGAGKTTLLKILLGVTEPTRGKVIRHGKVQALMSTGTGFHPDYTGLENAQSALEFTDLGTADYAAALADIEDFCELGEFWHQPFRTYSLGMQARLMFAAATAVRPEILIVDEVLGAGDAYFVEKSRLRVQKLVSDGLTLILVSHSMQQVLELCSEAVWLDAGRVRMSGESFEVVKAYEEYMHNTSAGLAMDPPKTTKPEPVGLTSAEPGSWRLELIGGRQTRPMVMQSPDFAPNSRAWNVKRDAVASGFRSVAPGGVSKWEPVDPGPKLLGFQIESVTGPTDVLRELEPALFRLTLASTAEGWLDTRYAVVISDQLGRTVARILSPVESFNWSVDVMRDVCVILDPLQLGAGTYDVGVSIISGTALETMNSARRYDLASRSFRFVVESPDSSPFSECRFMHSAEWALDA